MIEHKRLIDFRPDLVAQLHPTKNIHLNIDTIGLYSNKLVVWTCDKCNYEYSMIIANKTRYNQRCPACSGKVATQQNNFAVKFPGLLKEWDYDANNAIGLDPYKLLPFSGKEAWWRCDKGHKWFVKVAKRAVGHGCHYCCNYKVCTDNCLATVHPEIKDWDFEGNYPLTPYDVTSQTAKVVLWKCKRHGSYRCRVSHHVNGHGCPLCNNQDSKLQLFLYSEIRYFYPKAIYKHKIGRAEIDIYLPEYKVGIELSGYYWHKGSLEADKSKSLIFDKEGITIINVRENGLAEINNNTVRYNKHDDPLSVSKNMMICLYNIIKDERLKGYQDIVNPINEREYLDKVAKYPAPPYEMSLEYLNPKLAKEWDYSKNGNLKPSDVYLTSHIKVWWKCEFDHSWGSIVSNRRNSGCPICWSNHRKK